MSRKTLIVASALLLSATAAHAFNLGGNLGLSTQAQAGSAQGSANVGANADTGLSLQGLKDSAISAAQSGKEAGINAGTSAMATGKSAAASVNEAAHAAASSAKSTGASAIDAVQTKFGQGQQALSSTSASAENRISLKDKLALTKHFASATAATKASAGLTGLFGGNAQASTSANANLPVGYESKLVIGSKLDTSLASQSQVIDTSTVAKLSAQPKGTELLQIGNSIVRVDSKTHIVLDVTSTSPL